jgi:hypothetical protein
MSRARRCKRASGVGHREGFGGGSVIWNAFIRAILLLSQNRAEIAIEQPILPGIELL